MPLRQTSPPARADSRRRPASDRPRHGCDGSASASAARGPATLHVSCGSCWPDRPGGRTSHRPRRAGPGTSRSGTHRRAWPATGTEPAASSPPRAPARTDRSPRWPGRQRPPPARRRTRSGHRGWATPGRLVAWEEREEREERETWETWRWAWRLRRPAQRPEPEVAGAGAGGAETAVRTRTLPSG